ncbi:hypothetical protein JTB14_016558 [Gonioctena quinquepunctata]|nr:hypothetical protein JTB14_016558 [Gonioctena quinquepunctata]
MRVSYLENRPFPTSSLPEKDFIAESLERLECGKNVIILGIPEQFPEHDFQYIKKTAAELDPNSANLIRSGSRLGKPTNSKDKPRPYRLVLESQDAALCLIKNSRNILPNLHPEIKFKSDLTPHQLNHINDLRQELQERSIMDKNLTIKYVHGIPKIVQLSNKRLRAEEIFPRRDQGHNVHKIPHVIS